jgi:hypothetical protein
MNDARDGQLQDVIELRDITINGNDALDRVGIVNMAAGSLSALDLEVLITVRFGVCLSDLIM